MKKQHPVKTIVKLQKKQIPIGIVSICSANRFVIEAAFRRALTLNTEVLIEATANQVNQFGGYTGMTPALFYEYVLDLAASCDFQESKLILGGDHLGPLVWKAFDSEKAMFFAEELVYQYVRAGFTKIHLDTSMKLKEDGDGSLSNEVIAERAVRLARKAYEGYCERKLEIPETDEPVFVIGSEVPIPGGAQECEDVVRITSPEAFRETVTVFRSAFEENGLSNLWHQVIAVVVQPGVEFGDAQICEYDRREARALTDAIKDFPSLVFEGHSTDYQTTRGLREMVEDGIAILKVGPAMTFALRETLFSLELIEKELMPFCIGQPSNLRIHLESAMLCRPSNWEQHYHGTEAEVCLARKYSFSDRLRYYFVDEEVEAAIDRLLTNLETVAIPLTLLSQYVPMQYRKIRRGALENNVHDILMDGIIAELDRYYLATLRRPSWEEWL